jgi:hypothetical protein
MSIEYLADAEVGTILDPKRLERRKAEKKIHLEQFLPLLKSGLKMMSRETNQHYGEILNEDGQITLVGPEAESDQQLVEQQKIAFAHGLSPEEYRRQRETNQAEIAEMTLALLFNKLLGDRFLVARASSYDDFNNGVDLVIIDKTTGAVVCGVDDVVSHTADISAPKKDEKMARQMKAGGASIKYGATFAEGSLKRCSLRNIPTFHAAVSPAELEKIIMALEGNEKTSTLPELEVFERMISSLEEQYKKLDDTDLDPKLKENLQKFSASLERMKKAR